MKIWVAAEELNGDRWTFEGKFGQGTFFCNAIVPLSSALAASGHSLFEMVEGIDALQRVIGQATINDMTVLEDGTSIRVSY